MVKTRKPLVPRSQFIMHIIRNLLISIVFIAIALFIGMAGYHGFEHMPWLDAFLNASMILSGMGPVNTLVTPYGKLFAGLYALFSGLAFIAIMGLIFAPIVNRFFRQIHLDM